MSEPTTGQWTGAFLLALLLHGGALIVLALHTASPPVDVSATPRAAVEIGDQDASLPQPVGSAPLPEAQSDELLPEAVDARPPEATTAEPATPSMKSAEVPSLPEPDAASPAVTPAVEPDPQRVTDALPPRTPATTEADVPRPPTRRQATADIEDAPRKAAAVQPPEAPTSSAPERLAETVPPKILPATQAPPIRSRAPPEATRATDTMPQTVAEARPPQASPATRLTPQAQFDAAPDPSSGLPLEASAAGIPPPASSMATASAAQPETASSTTPIIEEETPIPARDEDTAREQPQAPPPPRSLPEQGPQEATGARSPDTGSPERPVVTQPTVRPMAESEPVRDAPPRHTADEAAVPVVTARVASDPGEPASSESDTAAANLLETYLARIRTHLDDYKEYPDETRRRGEEGTALVWLVIDRAGRVIDYRIEESSGYSGLDREARNMIRRAEPFPAMPDGMERSHLAIHVPVRFRLR